MKNARSENSSASASADRSAAQVNEVMSDLLELQSAGMKVMMPKCEATVTAHPDREQIPPAVSPAPERNWDHVPSTILNDFVELEELGGVPSWPEGLSTKLAKQLLRARKQ